MYLDLKDLNRSIRDPLICYGGGGKSPSVQTVAATPTPAPPAEEATMREYTDPNADKTKLKAKTQGATSLQIPLGSLGTSGTVGTV